MYSFKRRRWIWIEVNEILRTISIPGIPSLVIRRCCISYGSLVDQRRMMHSSSMYHHRAPASMLLVHMNSRRAVVLLSLVSFLFFFNFIAVFLLVFMLVASASRIVHGNTDAATLPRRSKPSIETRPSGTLCALSPEFTRSMLKTLLELSHD